MSRSAPATLLDLGGGTGAAAWAAVDRWPEIREVTVVDQVRDALDLGAGLAAESPSPALRSAAWLAQPLGGAVPDADLVTVSYVLGELDRRGTAATRRRGDGGRRHRGDRGAGHARRLRADPRGARSRLIESGRVIVAPCPHQAACPMPPGKDWCHFGARVNRSALHRKVKDADLSYEDEKFSYVVAVAGRRPLGRCPMPGFCGGRCSGKGLVQLHLCQPDGTVADLS